MKCLWIARCEVAVEPGDLPSGSTLGFCNVITWADETKEVVDKIRAYLATFKWDLIDAAEVKLANLDKDYGNTLNELIDQAAGNPHAIILSAFHSYKTN